MTGFLVATALQLKAMQRDPRISTVGTSESKVRMGIGFSFVPITVTIISVSLGRVLSTARNGIKKTHTLLQRLLLFTVSRFLLVLINSIAFIIVFETVASSLDWFPFILFASKLHVLCMLTLLNARASPAQQDVISMTNTDSNFPVADASHSKSQVMHLSLLNGTGNLSDVLKIHNHDRLGASEFYVARETPASDVEALALTPRATLPTEISVR